MTHVIYEVVKWAAIIGFSFGAPWAFLTWVERVSPPDEPLRPPDE